MLRTLALSFHSVLTISIRSGGRISPFRFIRVRNTPEKILGRTSPRTKRITFLTANPVPEYTLAFKKILFLRNSAWLWSAAFIRYYPSTSTDLSIASQRINTNFSSFLTVPYTPVVSIIWFWRLVAQLIFIPLNFTIGCVLTLMVHHVRLISIVVCRTSILIAKERE